MRRYKHPDIEIHDENGRVLFQGKTVELPVREDTIRALSVEYYQNPAPCIIHRSALMSRLYGELEEALCGEESLLWSDMPQGLKEAFVLQGPCRIQKR